MARNSSQPQNNDGGSSMNSDLEVEMDGAPISESIVAVVAKAELDQAIATAKAFPRNVPAVIRELTQLVTMSEDVAESCIFTLPRGKGADKKDITGPSIRFAEIAFSCWGNAIAGGRALAAEAEDVVAEGIFHDLQRNTKTIQQVRRRITGKYGRFNADMIVVTGNAAASIAKRNAIVAGIPKAFWQPAYDAARGVAIGTKDTLPQRRQRAVEWFAHYGVDPASVCIRLGVATVMDITLEHLEVLTGLKTAIRDGEDPRAAFTPPALDEKAPPTTSRTARPSEAPHAGKAATIPPTEGEQQSLIGDPPAAAATPKAAKGKPEPAAAASPSNDPTDLYREIDELLEQLVPDGDGGVKVQYERAARKNVGAPEAGDLPLAVLVALRDELKKTLAGVIK